MVDSAMILDSIVKGLGQIMLSKSRRKYAWGLFNAYLFGLQTGKVAIYRVFAYEARNNRLWNLEIEKAILFGDSSIWKMLGKVISDHPINKAKAIIASVLNRGGLLEGRRRKKAIEEIREYIEDAVDSGDIAKVRTAGILLLYLKLYNSICWHKGKVPEVKMEWLVEMRKAIEVIVRMWREKKKIEKKGDVLLFRLTREVRYLDSIDKIKKPQYWFVWI